MIGKYDECCNGELPKGVKDWAYLTAITNSLVIVDEAPQGSCMPCDANPFNLRCRCKGGRKIGMCSHILVVTHLIMKARPHAERSVEHNVKYMVANVAGHRPAHRPKKVKHFLLREDSDGEADSSPLQYEW